MMSSLPPGALDHLLLKTLEQERQAIKDLQRQAQRHGQAFMHSCTYFDLPQTA